MLSAVTATFLIVASILILAHEGMAQTSASQTGTRLITLGTLGGPTPRAHRAQSSNLLIVNGAFTLSTPRMASRVDLRKRVLTFVTSELSSSRTIMMTTRQVLEP